MTTVRKVCVVTGSRAEYGLLQWIMRRLQHDPRVDLQVLVTGMHLSPEFGNTWRAIAADGFAIHRKVEMLLSSDSFLGMAKSAGIGLEGMADALHDLSPDLILVLGDRFEIFSASAAAVLLRIPVAHVHGGEVTEGAIDDSLRHAVTKLAHLHFASTERYRQRIIQMGEDPDRVYCYGAPGLDSMVPLPPLSRAALEESLGFSLGERFFLITFHSVTRSSISSTAQLAALLEALAEMPTDVRFLFTFPNADAGGRALADQIREFVRLNPELSAAFESLGQLRYVSAMKHCVAVVGNSSSGIIEAPSLGVGIVNIGDRQKGRVQADSVINCEPAREAISRALARALSPAYRQSSALVANPYGKPGASEAIAEILATRPLTDASRKSFHDLP